MNQITEMQGEINRLRAELDKLSILPTLDDDDFEYLNGYNDYAEADIPLTTKQIARAHTVLTVMMTSLLGEFRRNHEGEDDLWDAVKVAQGAGMALAAPVKIFTDGMPAEKKNLFEDLLMVEIRRGFNRAFRKTEPPND